MLHSFLLAVQFLTRIPVSLVLSVNPHHHGKSVLFYPLVGLLIGCILYSCQILLQTVPVNTAAALILSIWVILTGGLHLDGLADSADAWAGGLGDKQRTLAIMKDPASGPVAVVILILVLLLKWSALTEIIDNGPRFALCLAPLLGRTAILILMVSTPYVRAGGIAEQLYNHLPRLSAAIVLIVTCLLVVIFFGVSPLLFTILIITAIRHLAIKRIDGITGDILGAGVELVEVVVLTVLVF